MCIFKIKDTVLFKPVEMGRRDIQILETIILKLFPRRGDLWESIMSDISWPMRDFPLRPAPPRPSPRSSQEQRTLTHVRPVWLMLVFGWRLIKAPCFLWPWMRYYHPIVRLRHWDSTIQLIVLDVHLGGSQIEPDEGVLNTSPYSVWK